MFKDRLKERREALGLSQSELGRRLGIDRQRIIGYEHGIRRADGDMISAFADALNCTTDYLLGRTDTP